MTGVQTCALPIAKSVKSPIIPFGTKRPRVQIPAPRPHHHLAFNKLGDEFFYSLKAQRPCNHRVSGPFLFRIGGDFLPWQGNFPIFSVKISRTLFLFQTMTDTAAHWNTLFHTTKCNYWCALFCDPVPVKLHALSYTHAVYERCFMVCLTGNARGDFQYIAHFCASIHTRSSDIIIILGYTGINFSGGYGSAQKSSAVCCL